MDKRKFIVIEIQKTADGNVAQITTIHQTMNEALNKFHTVMAYAAVSDLPKHACAILDEDGYLQRQECFEHEQEDTENAGND